MTTQLDVAEYAKVSYMTVSRVINNSSSVKEETRERVLEAIRVLNYHPNAAAQALAGGRTSTIGVVFPENEYVLSRQYFVELTNKIELSLSRRGFHLFLGAGRLPAGPETLENLVKKKKVDGLVMVAPPLGDPRLEVLASQLPVTVVHGEVRPVSYSVFDIDNRHAALLALQHVWDQGHRAIALVTGLLQEITAHDRLETYQTFLTQKKCTPQAGWTFAGDWSLESGYRGFQHVMKGPSRPSAVIFSNDQMAIGGLKAAHDAGLRVPDDVSIVGFDNTEYSSFVSPALTTVDMRIDELARVSVDALLDTVLDKAPPRQALVSPVLVVRDSSASVSAHNFRK